MQGVEVMPPVACTEENEIIPTEEAVDSQGELVEEPRLENGAMAELMEIRSAETHKTFRVGAR